MKRKSESEREERGGRREEKKRSYGREKEVRKVKDDKNQDKRRKKIAK